MLTIALQGIVHPVLAWVFVPMGLPTPPYMPGELLWGIVAALGTLAGIRSFDKVKGVAPAAAKP